MMKRQAKTIELKGSNYEIGKRLGEMAAAIPPMKRALTAKQGQLHEDDLQRAISLFDEWCPGLNEEIQGFADGLGVAPKEFIFYGLTYLKPRCSQMVLLPSMTKNGHVLMARNYEFSPQFEDFSLMRTSVEGKYTHMGSSIVQLGREEGVNECGLGVTMSSCGFPVGADKTMRNPALRGLQFWVVIRMLLENCKDVESALIMLKGMPIAYNLNLIVADRSGEAALIETVDGNMAVKRIDGSSKTQSLHATNHVVLPELMALEPTMMANSIQRFDFIQDSLSNGSAFTQEDLKKILLGRYPEGLTCHYYDEFFGTTKSVVMDLNEGSYSICWGGREENGWQKELVDRIVTEGLTPVQLIKEKADPTFFAMVER